MTIFQDLVHIRDILADLNGKGDWNRAEELLVHQARTCLENIAVERPMTRAEAEAAYKRACLDAADACDGLTPPYPSTWFRRMIARQGAVGATLHLTRPGSETQSGFFVLAVGRHRPDLTVEWLMLRPQFDSIFGDCPANRAVAYCRLQDVGVELTPEMAQRGQ